MLIHFFIGKKGQISFFLKALMLVTAVIAFSMIALLSQNFLSKTIEEKRSVEVEMKAMNILQKIINSDECLAYSYNDTISKGVINAYKLEEFTSNYNNTEPECAISYDFDYSIEVEQIPINFTIYSQVEGRFGVMLIIDQSGSMSDIMSTEDRSIKMDVAKEAAKIFVDALELEDKVGLVSYSSQAFLRVGLTTDHQKVKDEIDKLKADGSTNMRQAIEKSLKENPTSMVLMSDGCWNWGGDPIPKAYEAARKKVVIYTIGFGEDVKNCENRAGGAKSGEKALKEIARITGGNYSYAPNAEELKKIYKKLAGEVPKGGEIAGNVSVPQKKWYFGVGGVSGAGITQFSPEDSRYNDITLVLPVTIRFSEMNLKRGRIRIRAVEGELEKISNNLQRICDLADSEEISNEFELYLHHPMYYSDGKICMELNPSPCKQINCHIPIEFENITTEGNYYIKIKYDPIQNKILVNT